MTGAPKISTADEATKLSWSCYTCCVQGGDIHKKINQMKKEGNSSFKGKKGNNLVIKLVITRNQREKCQSAPKSGYLTTSFIYYIAHTSVLGSVCFHKEGL